MKGYSTPSIAPLSACPPPWTVKFLTSEGHSNQPKHDERLARRYPTLSMVPPPMSSSPW